MVIDKFLNIINREQEIQQLETVELKSIVEKFPYFQVARVLYLKGLKNQDSFKYNNELKITAAHSTDRTILFDYITATNFNLPKESIHQQITKKISTEKLTEVLSKTVHTLASKKAKQEKQITEAKQALEIGKPLSFSSSENHSFNEWLLLSKGKPIIRDEHKSIKKTTQKEELINKFIQNNPKIKPLDKDKTINISVSKNKQDTSLMTETLAKVYLEQKKYENAIQAYRILSLKYPEKSGFFADQIKRIQILQKNKS